MLIKAGTYRFNDVLTVTEANIEQSINCTFTMQGDDVSLVYYIDKMYVGVYEEDEGFSLYLNFNKLVVGDEEFEFNAPQLAYNKDGWTDNVPPHTITEDTEVADDFGTWYIANTRPINDETVKIENVIVFDEYGFKLSCNEVWGEIDGALNYIVVDTIPTDNILITDVNANVINMYYICDIDRIGTYDGANWNMYNATLIEDEAEAVDVGSPIAYVVVTYADGKEETPKKFTRLYLGDVAYSSNGKRFRKLQTEEYVEPSEPSEPEETESVIGTWKFNDVVDFSAWDDNHPATTSPAVYVYIDFISNGSTYNTFFMSESSLGWGIGYLGETNVHGVCHTQNSKYWTNKDVNYQTIEITGGADIENETFITWLKANATKIA